MGIKVALSNRFNEAKTRLPRDIQGKVDECVNKFFHNPQLKGLNFESIQGRKDKRISSVRVDETYRAIVRRDPETDVYVFLWVEHHKDVYRWANRECDYNARTGTLQLYAVVEPEVETTDVEDTLFGSLTDEELFDIGVPELQLGYIRSFMNREELVAAEENISEDVFEYLSLVADGIPYREVREYVESESRKVENIDEALELHTTLKSYKVVSDEEELEKMMDASLEKWRVFLHPDQRRLVERTFGGPARVLGGAGTGKTVVAMHRAKRLASLCLPGEKVLFTTFTENLSHDIRENVSTICSDAEMSRIEFVHLDAWVRDSLTKRGYRVVTEDKELDDIWKDAIKAATSEYVTSGTQFYKDEWSNVIVPQEAFTLEKYIAASRTGMRVPVPTSKKKILWPIFARYLEILNEKKICDRDYAVCRLRGLLESDQDFAGYKNIIVDEGQDFADHAYRLLRVMAGKEHENDIFIVGDSHQRIYNRVTVLSRCGINVRGGRSTILRINYRTTEEIRSAAFTLLKGVSFDDLDGADYTDDKSRSLTSGKEPTIINFMSLKEEENYVENEIRKLMQSGVRSSDICIVARTTDIVKSYRKALSERGISTYRIAGKAEDRSHEEVRIATIHRVKGLEFRYMFIVSANENVIPPYGNNFKGTPSKKELDLEKCLMYVAMTRAKIGVFITSYGMQSSLLKDICP
ncbi:MAG: UvrD-helicase domain-containing protein [Bacteroidales bacterium]|nr:UvrD-helicase domain-containing protein [Bacteroidales bacterium]